MGLDAADLKTETFTNSQGWTVVRVTHLPTALAVERSRSKELQSPVHAQSECVRELEGRVARGESGTVPAATPAQAAPAPAVTREEFDALVERVARLEADRPSQ